MNTPIRNQRRQGFTLIEMVGVLAIIAILAALLVPKIFAAINESRFSNTVASCNSVKAAAMSYFGKYSKFGGVAGAAIADAALPMTTYDSVLVTENMLERPFATKIGTAWTVQLASAAVAANQYDLDGSGAADVTSGRVLQCVITSVDAADAFELSQRMDGATMSAVANDGPDGIPGNADDVPQLGAADAKGRVAYAAPVNGKTDVRIYLAHK